LTGAELGKNNTTLHFIYDCHFVFTPLIQPNEKQDEDYLALAIVMTRFSGCYFALGAITLSPLVGL
jgi:hypothetical protein